MWYDLNAFVDEKYFILGTGGSTMNGRGNVPLGVDDADEDSPPGYMTAAGTKTLCLYV